jgi:2-C-methyl-D-erythritol 2,4-cyclodiphosphate synthase
MITTGIGIDVHRFIDGRPLVLGGITIPHDQGLKGHSDADVLAHAVTDALLGAACLGDIGEHFPDTDPKYKDANSIELLSHVVRLLELRQMVVRHVDLTVMAEAPKLSQHKAEIKESIAKTLKLSAEAVNIKATRGEGMGFIGRSEGMAVLAVASVERH